MMRDTQVEGLVEYAEDLGLSESEAMDVIVRENYCSCDDCYDTALGELRRAVDDARIDHLSSAIDGEMNRAEAELERSINAARYA